MNKLKYFSIILLFVLSACGGGSGGIGPEPQRGELVSATDKSSYSAGIINAGLTVGFPSAKYNARTIKIVYKTTDTDGNIIDASGLLAVPVKESGSASPLLVYHHGTIFQNEHAPTNNTALGFYGAYFASQDYIVLGPDYIGYGESAALLHPYLHANSLATTTVDMLRAVKEYLQQQNIPVQDKLFLTGYSEGGYAALAAHKVIEANYADEFTVTASVPGAGPYDMTATLNNYLLDGSTINLPGIMFAFAAYDSIYDMNRLTEFFQPPYDELAATAFMGATTETEILAQLAGVMEIADLFTSSFLTAYATDDGEAFLKARVIENNIYDWKPVAPIRFFHGSNDDVVQIRNSEIAVSAMQARSVGDDVDVFLQTCAEPSNAHLTCINAYTLYMLLTFAGY